ncbi:MAG TPA: avidin/streptavidin family protein [Pseudomonas sp.]|uniref:avidin/streptavidin family protein n=1 Tax=Pseudomonas sp. TaxID=306 RepID=UPI002ED8477C
MADSLVFQMQRGPFQNNGATPWFSTISLGTPGQPLKMAIDTGTNITWTTSSLCPKDRCQHYSAGLFDYKASSTFSFTDNLQRPYSFGPWGTMQVESGTDVLTAPDGSSLTAQLLLAADYAGDQFKQLDWDGGIGLPSSSAYVEAHSSFLFQEWLQLGRIDPRQPYVAFDWDADTKSGTCQMGGVDASKIKGPHLFLPWSVYSQLPGVEYIWATDLKSWSVGGETLASDIKFALDSGSSQFKGDDNVMRQTLKHIARGGHPEVVLEFADGEITLGANLYNIKVEEGPQKGQVLPQFTPLGLPELVLVGSVVMEHCYTVYEYQVVERSPKLYSVAPVGIWLFNRSHGPQIITRSSARSFDPGPRTVASKKIILTPPIPVQSRLETVAGTWKNDYGSVMTLSVSGNQVSGTYESSTGSSGKYPVTGYQLEAAATPEHGQPIALAIEWHSTGNDPADPSWNWSSGLCGQISITDKAQVLTLSHLLVATSDFPGLADSATYIDKLTYRRVSAEQNLYSAVTHDEPVPDALNGTWVATDGSVLKLSVHACDQHRFGLVRGNLSSVSGDIEVSGFTDINAAASGLSLQSVSLTAARESAVISWSGSLDRTNNQLSVMLMSSTPTAATHSYVQTQISALSFKRKPE